MAAVASIFLALNVQPILDAQLTTEEGKAIFAQKVQYFVTEFNSSLERMNKLKTEMFQENPDIKQLPAGSEAYRVQAQKCQTIYDAFRAAKVVMDEMATIAAAGGDALKDPQKVVDLAQAYQAGEQPSEVNAKFLERVAIICSRSL